ncbi:MAG TPA: DNA repair exonuclease, partial [Spirochaetia bacterium]|nr:DNA repair exonuclease [Spirochaetia bacterium]
MVEFIHTSDWHLGNPFSAFSEEQQLRLAEARFEGITRLFSYARSKGVRLLLAAGDQIDNGELRDTSVLLRLFGIISRFPEIQVVMIPGNHDPLSSGSIYSRVDDSSYPANLLFVRRPQSLDLPDLGIRILAAPLLERFGRVNPIVSLAAESVPDEGVVTIGLAHGSLAVSDRVGGESDGFPVPPTLARDQGIDYLALGDWHSYLKSGDRTFYPGTHEALTFGDDAGSLHVRIAGAGHRPEALRIDRSVMCWRELRRTLRDESLDAFLLEWGGGDRDASGPDLGPLFSAGGGRVDVGKGTS